MGSTIVHAHSGLRGPRTFEEVESKHDVDGADVIDIDDTESESAVGVMLIEKCEKIFIAIDGRPE